MHHYIKSEFVRGDCGRISRPKISERPLRLLFFEGLWVVAMTPEWNLEK